MESESEWISDESLSYHSEWNTVAGNTERNINYKCNAWLELVYGILLLYSY